MRNEEGGIAFEYYATKKWRRYPCFLTSRKLVHEGDLGLLDKVEDSQTLIEPLDHAACHPFLSLIGFPLANTFFDPAVTKSNWKHESSCEQITGGECITMRILMIKF